MSRDYVIINGKNSLEVQGLAIKLLPPISKPTMRTIREEIDGRDGDIVTNLGYQAYDKAMEIGLFGTYDINDVIAFFNSEGTIVFSDESDKYYNFKILDKIDYTSLIKFRTATITIHCQPFKYPLNETPLVEEYEYVEATGSNVTLDNTSEAIFNKIDLIGNTEQTQYTGKNKMPTATTISTTGTTSNGITFTRLEDGTIKANGTATAGVSIYLNNDWNVMSTGTYTLGDGIASGQSGDTFFLYADVQHTDGSAWDAKNFSTATPTTKTRIMEEAFRYKPRIVVRQGQTLNNLIFKPQFETGSSATTYEPYVGGIPSPNPNYPQDIHVVSGDNKITITGKNILFYDSKTTNWNGASIKTEGNLITYTPSSSGTGGMSHNSYNQYIKIPSGTTLTYSQQYLSGSVWTSGSLTNVIRLLREDGTYTNVSFGDILPSNYNVRRKVTYTTTEDYVGFYCYSMLYGITGATTPLVYQVQLEYNSVATDFEPYQGQSLPLYLGVLGKNLFTSKVEQGAINQSIGSTYEQCKSTNLTRIRTEKLIRIDEGTSYTFSFNSSYSLAVQPFDQNGKMKNPPTNYGVWKSTTFSISTTGVYYIALAFKKNSEANITPAEINDIQVMFEAGTTASTYEAPNPLELAMIPNTNYEDEFIKDGETWYKHAMIGKVLFDGTESWTFTTNGNAWYVSGWATPNNAKIPSDNSLKSESLSNYFVNVARNELVGVTNGIGIASSGAVNMKHQDYSSDANQATDFKAWLGTNKPSIYYILNTPTDTEITNTTLIDQLEAIKNAISYNGQTNISQTNNDLPFILDLSALKENSDHLVIDNIGNIYSKPTLDLEGTGIVDIYLNDSQMFEVDLSEKNEIVIDTEKMEAYNPTDNTLANRQVTGDYSKFKLDSGENDLRFSGDLTKATITNYERWL